MKFRQSINFKNNTIFYLVFRLMIQFFSNDFEQVAIALTNASVWSSPLDFRIPNFGIHFLRFSEI